MILGEYFKPWRPKIGISTAIVRFAARASPDVDHDFASGLTGRLTVQASNTDIFSLGPAKPGSVPRVTVDRLAHSKF
jgi:hypothetical protein